MSQMNWKCWVAAASVLVACWCAADGPGKLEQQKCQVVQAALERQGIPELSPALLKAIARADALLDIGLGKSPEPRLVTLRTTGMPLCETFALDKGCRIVVDLYNVINFRSGTIGVPGKQSLIRQVRSSLFAIEPQFVSRVVIDLAAPCTYNIVKSDKEVVIDLVAAPELSDIAPASAGSIAETSLSLANRKVRVQILVAAFDESEQRTEAKNRPAVDNAIALQQACQEKLNRGFNALDLLLATVAKKQASAAPEPPLAQLDAALKQIDRQADATDTPVPAPSFSYDDARVAAIRMQEAVGPWAAAFRTAAGSVYAQAGQYAQTCAAAIEQLKPAVPAPAETLAVAPAPAAPVEEQRLAQLVTELEAVRSAQPDLQTSFLAPLAALADHEGRDAVSGMSEEVAPPPGKRDAPPEAAGLKWYTVERPPAEDMLLAEAAEVPVTDAQEVERVYKPEDVAAPVETKKDAPRPAVSGDPLEQMVDIDFRDMELNQVVGLLADRAHINVVADAKVSGKVTARLTGVTLRQAMETVLRLNGLGIIQEDAVYRIVSYKDVMAALQVRRIVYLEHAKVEDAKKTLQEVVVGLPDTEQVTLSANESTNVLILSGPENRVSELEDIIREIDVTEPVLPTVTEAIKLNYATPSELIKTFGKNMMSKDIGELSADDRGRFLIVTDIPIKVEKIRELVKEIDMPAKQVRIDAMIVDAVLVDDAETGVDWLLNAVRRTNTRGEAVGNLKDLFLDTALGGPTTSQLTFNVLTKHLDLNGIIGAQVKDNKGRLLANPGITTVENQVARINITTQVPYDEKQQSLTGPPMVSTGFKEVGTILEVTPRVTHDDYILVEVMAKQSALGELAVNGIPTEIKREAETSLRTKNNQTIFIGGLRGHDARTDVTKVPVLGDVPVVNFLFRRSSVRKQSTELLIFLTCNILPDEVPELTIEQQTEHDRIDQLPAVTTSQKELFRTIPHPNENRPPVWRRSK